MPTDPFDSIRMPIKGESEEISQSTFAELVWIKECENAPAIGKPNPNVKLSLNKAAFGKDCVNSLRNVVTDQPQFSPIIASSADQGVLSYKLAKSKQSPALLKSQRIEQRFKDVVVNQVEEPIRAYSVAGTESCASGETIYSYQNFKTDSGIWTGGILDTTEEVILIEPESEIKTNAIFLDEYPDGIFGRLNINLITDSTISVRIITKDIETGQQIEDTVDLDGENVHEISFFAHNFILIIINNNGTNDAKISDITWCNQEPLISGSMSDVKLYLRWQNDLNGGVIDYPVNLFYIFLDVTFRSLTDPSDRIQKVYCPSNVGGDSSLACDKWKASSIEGSTVDAPVNNYPGVNLIDWDQLCVTNIEDRGLFVNVANWREAEGKWFYTKPNVINESPDCCGHQNPDYLIWFFDDISELGYVIETVSAKYLHNIIRPSGVSVDNPYIFPTEGYNLACDLQTITPDPIIISIREDLGEPDCDTQSIVRNGDFSAAFPQVNGGAAQFWTTNSVDVFSHHLLYTGEPVNIWIDLNSCGPGYIEQTLDTIIGGYYALKFNKAANNLGFDVTTPRTFNVALRSTNIPTRIYSYSFDPTGTTPGTYDGMGWESETLIFKALATRTAIRFISSYNIVGSNCYGPAIDNVCVVPLTVGCGTSVANPYNTTIEVDERAGRYEITYDPFDQSKNLIIEDENGNVLLETGNMVGSEASTSIVCEEPGNQAVNYYINKNLGVKSLTIRVENENNSITDITNLYIKITPPTTTVPPPDNLEFRLNYVNALGESRGPVKYANKYDLFIQNKPVAEMLGWDAPTNYISDINDPSRGISGDIARWNRVDFGLDLPTGGGSDQITQPIDIDFVGSGNIFFGGSSKFGMKGEGFLYASCDPEIIIEDVVDGTKVNERQSIVLPTATGGKWELIWRNDGVTQSVRIDYGATALQVKNRFGSLSIVGAKRNLEVIGSGTAEDPYVIEFVNDLAGLNLRPIRVDTSLLIGTSNSFVSGLIDGTTDEQKTIQNLSNNPADFYVQFDGVESGPISSNASLNEITSILEGMSNIGSGNIIAYGDISDRDAGYSGPYRLRFIGDYSGQNVSDMTIRPNGYTIRTDWNGGSTGGINEQQKINILANGGTFALTLTGPSEGDQAPPTGKTSPIAYNASASTIRTRILNDIDWLQGDDIGVRELTRDTVNNIYEHRLEFRGRYRKQNIPLAQLDNRALSGGTATVTILQDGYGIRDQQRLTIYRANSGSFTLTIRVNGRAHTTSDIPWNTTDNVLKAKIEQLPPFEVDDVVVERQPIDNAEQNAKFLLGFRRKFGDIPTIRANIQNLVCDPSGLPRVPEGPYFYPLEQCDEIDNDFDYDDGPLLCRPGPGSPAVDTDPCCDAINIPNSINVSKRLRIERDLFDPNSTRTIKDLATIKGLSTSSYTPYIRQGNQLTETSYNTTIRPKMSILLIPNNLNTENGINRIITQVSKNEILTGRYNWPECDPQIPNNCW